MRAAVATLIASVSASSAESNALKSPPFIAAFILFMISTRASAARAAISSESAESSESRASESKSDSHSPSDDSSGNESSSESPKPSSSESPKPSLMPSMISCMNGGITVSRPVSVCARSKFPRSLANCSGLAIDSCTMSSTSSPRKIASIVFMPVGPSVRCISATISAGWLAIILSTSARSDDPAASTADPSADPSGFSRWILRFSRWLRRFST